MASFKYDNVDELVRDFHRTGNQEYRDRAIVLSQEMVRKRVRGILIERPGLDKLVDEDDLVQEGMFGVIEAIPKFELERGIRFSTYALTLVKGHVFEYLRELDFFSRSARDKINRLEKFKNEFIAKNKFSPSYQDYKKNCIIIGINKKHLRKYLEYCSIDDKSFSMEIFKLEEAKIHSKTKEDRKKSFPKNLITPPEDDPSEKCNGFTPAYALDLIDLGKEKCDIFYLYFFKDKTMKQIGEDVGLSECRVSQIISRCLKDPTKFRRLRQHYS